MTEIGKIIVFRVLAKSGQLKTNKFCRQFYGYLDRSHNYKYQYQRKGFIDNFPHIKPLRGVLVVRKDDSDEIIEFLKSYNAELYARDIVLQDEDLKKLKPIPVE